MSHPLTYHSPAESWPAPRPSSFRKISTTVRCTPPPHISPDEIKETVPSFLPNQEHLHGYRPHINQTDVGDEAVRQTHHLVEVDKEDWVCRASEVAHLMKRSGHCAAAKRNIVHPTCGPGIAPPHNQLVEGNLLLQNSPNKGSGIMPLLG